MCCRRCWLRRPVGGLFVRWKVSAEVLSVVCVVAAKLNDMLNRITKMICPKYDQRVFGFWVEEAHSKEREGREIKQETKGEEGAITRRG